jgi:HTH domain
VSGVSGVNGHEPARHPLLKAVQPVVDAVGATLVTVDEQEASDVPLVWDGEVVGAVRMPPLHGALDRLIDAVEAELGGRLPTLSREDKQRAVRMLDQRGAFILRRAVEDVADALGVSRITVYNYLNAIHR